MENSIKGQNTGELKFAVQVVAARNILSLSSTELQSSLAGKKYMRILNKSKDFEQLKIITSVSYKLYTFALENGDDIYIYIYMDFTNVCPKGTQQ